MRQRKGCGTGGAKGHPWRNICFGSTSGHVSVVHVDERNPIQAYQSSVRLVWCVSMKVAQGWRRGLLVDDRNRVDERGHLLLHPGPVGSVRLLHEVVHVGNHPHVTVTVVI